MMIVRPVRMEDLDRVFELATAANYGLTSLPRDREMLQRRVGESLHAFQKQAERPGGELYLFIMEDLETEAVIGTSCLVSKVGGFQPFWAYRVETCVHKCDALGIRKEISTLHLVKEHSGPSEIGGLFLGREYRKHGNGRLLSLFRFLFVAEFPERFEPTMIAEMRGVVESDGTSPFWEAIGRHFFDIDYPSADLLSVMDKRFIADLMLTCPVYIPLLPQSAQEVIGKVHQRTAPALKMLLDEGFDYTGMVDIFEGGPVISCPMAEIRIVRESRSAEVEAIASGAVETLPCIIARFGGDFRACAGDVALGEESGVIISPEVAAALGIRQRDRVRFAPMRPSGNRPGAQL
jgi:arginine N-succinyltransferase